MEGRVRARRAILGLCSPRGRLHGEDGPWSALGSDDGARQPRGDGNVSDAIWVLGFSIRSCSGQLTLLCVDDHHLSLYLPGLLLLDAGNRSLNRSSDSTPTSPLMRSSSSSRAEIGGRSRRLLRRFLRGCRTPFGASMVVCRDGAASMDRGVSNRGSVFGACDPL